MPELMGMKTVSSGLIGIQTAWLELMGITTVSPGIIGMLVFLFCFNVGDH
jgi:hypothetical protein